VGRSQAGNIAVYQQEAGIVQKVKSSMGGGESATQIVFGWTNGVLDWGRSILPQGGARSRNARRASGDRQ
jgi:hypothetical protein